MVLSCRLGEGESASFELESESKEYLEEYILQYHKSKRVYFVSGCRVDEDFYHDKVTGYAIILSGSDSGDSIGGDVIRFSDGNILPWFTLNFLDGDFSFDVLGGAWSRALALDIYESLSQGEFSMVRNLTSDLLISKSITRRCNSDYSMIKAYEGLD